MSNNATPERCVPHKDAWSLDDRKQMMRDVVKGSAGRNQLHILDSEEVAKTYASGRILASEVEAEKLKYPTEECGK